MKKYNVKFKNGYRVEITDSEGKPRREIVDWAKKIYKMAMDSHPRIEPKSNLLPQIRKIAGPTGAINSKGVVVNEDLLNYEIRKLELDMNSDLKHENWYKKYRNGELEAIINDYRKFIAAIRTAKDERYQAKADELEEKLSEIITIFHLEGMDGGSDGDLVEDMGVRMPYRSVSFNPDPYFSIEDIDFANDYLNDKNHKDDANDILEVEYPNIRQNLENDIEQGEDLLEKFHKDDLRTWIDTYKQIIDVYKRSRLTAEAKILEDLYLKLYYNILHLGKRESERLSNSKTVRVHSPRR